MSRVVGLRVDHQLMRKGVIRWQMYDWWHRTGWGLWG